MAPIPGNALENYGAHAATRDFTGGGAGHIGTWQVFDQVKILTAVAHLEQLWFPFT